MGLIDYLIEPEEKYKERKKKEAAERTRYDTLSRYDKKELSVDERAELRGYERSKSKTRSIGGYLAKWGGVDLREGTRRQRREYEDEDEYYRNRHGRKKRRRRKKRFVKGVTRGLDDLTGAFRDISRGPYGRKKPWWM